MAASNDKKALRRKAEARLREGDLTASTRLEMSPRDEEFVAFAMRALSTAGIKARIRRPGEGPFDPPDAPETRNMVAVITRPSGDHFLVDLRGMLNSSDPNGALLARVAEIAEVLQTERSRYQTNIQKYLTFTTVPGKDAFATWQELQTHSDGFYPLIIGSARNKKEIQDRVGWHAQDGPRILELATSSSLEELESVRAQELDWKDDNRELIGVCNAESAYKHSLQGHKTGLQFLARCIIARLAVDCSWKVPAVLGLGSWNLSPAAHVHCLLHKVWQERYDSRIVSFGGDTLECVVGAPPDTSAEAMRLARQQYLYAPDIVEQGTGTIGALAECLINAKYWFFWWD